MGIFISRRAKTLRSKPSNCRTPLIPITIGTSGCGGMLRAERDLPYPGRSAAHHRLVNNYAKISFNFGPTLLLWLEAESPLLSQAILEGDRQSQQCFGVTAPRIAQAYNHMIMPLAHQRDKVTQVLWGITDFEHRFGRQPEGMWLPETAVDIRTLDVLAEHGISSRFWRRVRPIACAATAAAIGRTSRATASIPAALTSCACPRNETISLFFYDGPISQAWPLKDCSTTADDSRTACWVDFPMTATGRSFHISRPTAKPTAIITALARWR